ncbi:hypothetical protein T11_3733 [Trichinella zimbabwensis]|uniref:Uncharacterized protein n=1 Tax=Trichinella zimbabwensis TaxID=268475 RepID=A0A0V1HET8_9BILA|nr:hypothetical protein T11_3733 [Trichinella zimbabwensis]
MFLSSSPSYFLLNIVKVYLISAAQSTFSADISYLYLVNMEMGYVRIDNIDSEQRYNTVVFVTKCAAAVGKKTSDNYNHIKPFIQNCLLKCGLFIKETAGKNNRTLRIFREKFIINDII